MSNNKLITHILNEDRKSYEKDSLSFFTEKVDFFKIFDKDFNPIDSAIDFSKNKINDFLNNLFAGIYKKTKELIKNDSILKAYKDNEKQYQLANKKFKERLRVLIKKGQNIKDIKKDGMLIGLHYNMLERGMLSEFLKPYVNSNNSETSDKIVTTLDNVFEKSKKKHSELQKLEQEIIELQIGLQAGGGGTKFIQDTAILKQKLKQYARAKGYVSVSNMAKKGGGPAVNASRQQ